MYLFWGIISGSSVHLTKGEDELRGPSLGNRHPTLFLKKKGLQRDIVSIKEGKAARRPLISLREGGGG